MQYILFLIYALLVINVLVVLSKKELKEKYYVKSKMTASAGFMALAVIFSYMDGGICTGNSRCLLSLITAAFLCFIGDFFMGIYNVQRKKRFMALGILTFLLAHIGFILFLCNLVPDIYPIDVIIPMLMVVICYLLTTFAHLHLGRLKHAVAIYSFFVTAFMVKAVHVGLLGQPGILSLAGILFFLSDFSLLFLYFFHLHNKKLEVGLHIFNLLTYYVSIGCLVSVLI